MKNDWAEHKGIISVLLVAALALWGYNGYQVFRGVRPSASARMETAESRAVPARHFQAPPPPYLGDFRDPFAHPDHRPSTERKRSVPTPAPPGGEAEPERPRPLPLRLTGTIGETALLMDEAGRIHLARAGEEVGAVRIRTVERDHVTVEFDDRRHTLSLHNDSDAP